MCLCVGALRKPDTEVVGVILCGSALEFLHRTSHGAAWSAWTGWPVSSGIPVSAPTYAMLPYQTQTTIPNLLSCFWDRVSLCSSRQSRTQRDLPTSVQQPVPHLHPVLELKACATKTASHLDLCGFWRFELRSPCIQNQFSPPGNHLSTLLYSLWDRLLLCNPS